MAFSVNGYLKQNETSVKTWSLEFESVEQADFFLPIFLEPFVIWKKIDENEITKLA